MDFWQNLLIAVLAAIAVAIIGSVAYLLKNFVATPLLEYREVVGRVRNRLRYFANVITSPGARAGLAREASETCRQLSCDLDEHYAELSLKPLLVKLKLVPTDPEVAEAARSLIFLSNSTFDGEPLRNHDELEKISKNLHFSK